MDSDEALMMAFQRGSQEAFAELFERYREPIFRFFRRRLGSGQQAEDLTQETFVAVIRALSRYEPRASVRTYLYAIATRMLGAERRRLRRAEGGLRGDIGNEANSEAALWVRQALEGLDPTEREVLMLREYEQLTYAEIADVLRIPLNTVRSRLFRARAALKNCLEPTAREKAMEGGEGCL